MSADTLAALLAYNTRGEKKNKTKQQKGKRARHAYKPACTRSNTNTLRWVASQEEEPKELGQFPVDVCVYGHG